VTGTIAPRAAGQTGPAAAEPAAPRLTVVIVSYECRELLRDCLASLATQAAEVDAHVVVVDNASGDGTQDMVRADFPWVTLIANPENEGFGRACNVALRLVRAGHVLLLNPDTVLPADGLARSLQALEDRPSVGILGVRLVQRDGTVDHASRRQIPTPASSLAYLLKLRRPGSRTAYTDPTAFDTEGVVGAVNGAFMLMRDQAFEQVGGFDEDFWMYGEDLDLCLRTTQAGWDVHYWPGLEVLHVKGGSSGRARTFRVNKAFHSAMWLFYAKHQRATYGPLVTALVAVGIAGKFALSVLRSTLLRAVRRLTPTTTTKATAQ
jgi:N-acetylglucosaminyl-diphospho-decaprenol L-rhamnosyltransferase